MHDIFNFTAEDEVINYDSSGSELSDEESSQVINLDEEPIAARTKRRRRRVTIDLSSDEEEPIINNNSSSSVSNNKSSSSKSKEEYIDELERIIENQNYLIRCYSREVIELNKQIQQEHDL